jgi:flagellar hook assembly protein FlgD
MGLGPRAARIHVGSGRPTISTGAGPATVWTGVGPKRRATSGGGRAKGSGRGAQAAAGRAEVAERARQLAVLEAALVAAHQTAFPGTERAVAEPPAPVDEGAIRRDAKREQMVGISMFALKERAGARERAREVAQERIRAERAARLEAQTREQARLDNEWRRLLANDPAAVLEALERAFEDNQVAAVPIDCVDGAVSIVMLFPDSGQLPEKKPAVTPTGRQTVHTRTKTERGALHAQSMASHILATIREALAAAPAIERVTVLTVERTDAVGGIDTLSAIAVTGFEREQVERFNWERLDPLATIQAATLCMLNPKGRTGELAPLDLRHEPEIATVLVTCASLLGLELDPRVRIPPGTTPLPNEHEPITPTPPALAENEVTMAHTEAPSTPTPGSPSGGTNGPRDSSTSRGAWARFRRWPWWAQALAWLVASPVLASWWCWRRSWPIWGRLAAIAAIVLGSLILLGSFGGSNASKKTAAAPPRSSSTSATTSASQPASTAKAGKTHQAPLAQAHAAAAAFYPIEQDGFRDYARVYFRTAIPARDLVQVLNPLGRVVRTDNLGHLKADSTHSWSWDGRTATGKQANPGGYHIRVIARHAGHTTTAPAVLVQVRPLTPRVSRVSVAPSPFYPIEQDGYRDTTIITFTTNTTGRDTIHIRNKRGTLVRTVDLGALQGHAPHTWTWNGETASGHVGSPGTYRIQVLTTYYGQRAASPSRGVTIKRHQTATSTPSNCTPGYSPCLVYHGGADYDCAGGSGNGPYYTSPGVVYTVKGSDIYGLDANGNGLGCE